MCVLYVSFRSKVRPITFGYVEIVMFCPGQNFMYVWLYVFLCCTRACVCRCDGDVICVGHDLYWCSGWW